MNMKPEAGQSQEEGSGSFVQWPCSACVSESSPGAEAAGSSLQSHHQLLKDSTTPSFIRLHLKPMLRALDSLFRNAGHLQTCLSSYLM